MARMNSASDTFYVADAMCLHKGIPQEMPAISRWLSGATPPGNNRNEISIPEGSQSIMLRSLRDRAAHSHNIRWWRYADHRLMAGNPPG